MSVAIVAATLLALTACSGGGNPGSGEASAPTARDQLAAAKKVLDDTSSVHLKLTSQDVPEKADGVLGAEGDGTHAPAFKGSLEARIKGLQATVPVVAVDGGFWLKLPFSSSYVKEDPEKYNAPDPAELFSTDHGITTLLPATKDPKLGDKTREGKEVVQTINGTLPGKVVTDVLVIGDSKGHYDVTYGIVPDSKQIRTVALSGPFYPGATSTYTLRLDAYGQPVEITKP
jgi:lipoprotein LprG